MESPRCIDRYLVRSQKVPFKSKTKANITEEEILDLVLDEDDQVRLFCCGATYLIF